MSSDDWSAVVDRLRIYRTPGARPGLDGVRAIAILLVVAYHGTLTLGGGRALLPVMGTDLFAPILHGWMGVNLFFVLSGFLITHHLLRSWHRLPTSAQVWHYLTKRWLRIVPTYYVVLLVVWLGLVPYRRVAEDTASFQLLYHLFFLQDYLPSSIVAPFWSLGVEEKFYLAMPLVTVLMMGLDSTRMRLLLLGGIAAVPIVVRMAMFMQTDSVSFGEFILYWRNPFHLNLDALFLGAGAALIARSRSQIRWLSSAHAGQRLVLVGGILTLALMYWLGAGRAGELLNLVVVNSLVALAFAVLTLGVALRPVTPDNWLDHPLLGAAGRLAFPWYLTHTIVLWWLAPSVAAMPLMMSMLVYLICTMTIALLLHWAVERPCLLFKQSLDRAHIPVSEVAA